MTIDLLPQTLSIPSLKGRGSIRLNQQVVRVELKVRSDRTEHELGAALHANAKLERKKVCSEIVRRSSMAHCTDQTKEARADGDGSNLTFIVLR